MVRGISKRFGSTAALSGVSLNGRAGSIHAITGENGAGKSTLMKLLAGVHQPDAGQIVVNGRPTVLNGPMDARHAGISTVFQELTVLPNLTVGENLMLGREPRRFGLLDRSRMMAESSAVLKRIGIELDPRRACDTLSVGEQQLVEIAKGVSADANVFIFDEPTAALNRKEVDTVTVLKDGCWVATKPASALDTEQLITLMVGRPLQALFPPRRPEAGGGIAFDVRSLTPTRAGPPLSFKLSRGEIVGLGGLEGQGQRGESGGARCRADPRGPQARGSVP